MLLYFLKNATAGLFDGRFAWALRWRRCQPYQAEFDRFSHNRALVGDSAAVLAYTYFHLASVAQAEGQTDLSREYAQKSLALAERHKLADLRSEAEAMLKQKR